jgi:hypothetical protein
MYAQSDVRTYRTPWFGSTPWQKDAPIGAYWDNSPPNLKTAVGASFEVRRDVTVAIGRSARAADAPPLGTIRSLAYFAPAIGEVLRLKAGPEYLQHLRNGLQRSTPAR